MSLKFFDYRFLQKLGCRRKVSIIRLFGRGSKITVPDNLLTNAVIFNWGSPRNPRAPPAQPRGPRSYKNATKDGLFWLSCADADSGWATFQMNDQNSPLRRPSEGTLN